MFARLFERRLRGIELYIFSVLDKKLTNSSTQHCTDQYVRVQYEQINVQSAELSARS